MLSSGKSPGADSIPPEIYKEGGNQLVRWLTRLFHRIWDCKAISQDFKDALILHIIKRKDNWEFCANVRLEKANEKATYDHRAFPSHRLFNIADMLMSWWSSRHITTLLCWKDTRLCSSQSVNYTHLPSECSVWESMWFPCWQRIFAARQLQEKCREQHQNLYMVFIELTKAFDSVQQEGLWKILKKIGCPPKFINIDTIESNRLDQLKEKCQRHKLLPTAAAAGFICDNCRTCGSRIGSFWDLTSHEYRHFFYKSTVVVPWYHPSLQ